MDDDELVQRFEASRGHLRAVAYRMLGSFREADAALQEARARVSRSGAERIGDLSGWLTTVVARVCLDELRARRSRRREPFGGRASIATESFEQGLDADHLAVADAVGIALLVVLDTLAPAERLAFVLHDMFAVSFEDIAQLLGRSPLAARQLATRARQRMRGSMTR